MLVTFRSVGGEAVVLELAPDCTVETAVARLGQLWSPGQYRLVLAGRLLRPTDRLADHRANTTNLPVIAIRAPVPATTSVPAPALVTGPTQNFDEAASKEHYTNIVAETKKA